MRDLIYGSCFLTMVDNEMGFHQQRQAFRQGEFLEYPKKKKKSLIHRQPYPVRVQLPARKRSLGQVSNTNMRVLTKARCPKDEGHIQNVH